MTTFADVIGSQGRKALNQARPPQQQRRGGLKARLRRMGVVAVHIAYPGNANVRVPVIGGYFEAHEMSLIANSLAAGEYIITSKGVLEVTA